MKAFSLVDYILSGQKLRDSSNVLVSLLSVTTDITLSACLDLLTLFYITGLKINL